MTIPARTIPGFTIPAVHKAGIDLDAVHVAPVTTRAATAKPVSTPEVCQVRPKGADLVPSVLQPSLVRDSVVRDSVVRDSVVRDSVVRDSAVRDSACDDHGHCVRAVSVPSFSIPSLSASSVSAPARTLAARMVDGVQEFSDEHEVAYNLRTDVLFAFGKADVRRDAAGQLHTVADALKKKAPPGAAIRVDGYTDSKGGDSFNQALSVRRARAVAAWLADHGGVARSRMSTHGYGETHPAEPNTGPGGKDDPKGRQANRRVVVAVATG